MAFNARNKRDSRPSMSQLAAIEDERLEVMKILENPTPLNASSSLTAAAKKTSPRTSGTGSRQQVRSMLSVGSPTPSSSSLLSPSSSSLMKNKHRSSSATIREEAELLGQFRSMAPTPMSQRRKSSNHDQSGGTSGGGGGGVNMNFQKAYRTLSEPALKASGGSLSRLPNGPKQREGGIDGGDFLEKDHDPENAIDSSSSDSESDSEIEDMPKVVNQVSPRQAMSLSAAAEEERILLSSSDAALTKSQPPKKVSSLIPHSVQSLIPRDSKLPAHGQKKQNIHPNTNYDDVSKNNTPLTSDAENDVDDLKKAQALTIVHTEINSSAERSVRVITRGNFEEARDSAKRQRKYIVCTDMSNEAIHAIEWTIGTVLREGDELLAIYAMYRDEKDELNDQAKAERIKGAEEVTQVISKLLKRTRLQVKIQIEVIHTHNPKHIVIEMIDHIAPCMVILGSRGRSSLKGVLLGTFSNYLVSKSSVPVMVARRRLKKSSKKKGVLMTQFGRQANVLKLENAKID